MDRSTALLAVASASQGSAECFVWVLVGGSLVIAVCGGQDHCLITLIHMMAVPLLLNRRGVAGTIHPNQILTQTWMGVNMHSLYRDRHCLTARLLVAAHHTAVQGLWL